MDNALNTLKQYPLWTGCKIPDKTPLNPHTGGNAQSNNPSTFGTFDQAEAAKARLGWTHTGFAFVPEIAEIMGIDIDKCVDEDGTIEPWAMEIIKRIDSYAEFSPSGKGVHILCCGALPKNIGANDAPETCEMYDHGRWFTVTGDHVPGTPTTIERRYRQVLGLHADILQRIEAHKRPKPQPVMMEPATGDRAERYGQSALAGELAALAAAREGSRNEQLFKSTAALRELANAGALDWPTVEPALYDTALAIGLGENETLKTIESAKKRVNGTVRDIPPLDSARTDAHFQPSPQQDGPTQQRVEPALSEKNFWLSVEEITKKFFPREETGDAEVLAALYQRRIVYDHAEKKWYLWNGNHWVEDKKKRVVTFLSSKVAAVYLHAAAELKSQVENDVDKALAEEDTKSLHKRASSLRFKTRIKNVLELASSIDTLALSGDEWETDSNLLAVKNGIIDLKTGNFRPGQPEDYIRTFAPVEWKGLDAPAPRFEIFLQEIFAGDFELIRFVQRLLGHALLGQVYEHILPIFWGEGRNGKDTLIETLNHVLGDLAGPASKDVLIEGRNINPGGPTPHLYSLRFLRLTWVNETRAGAKLNTEQAKWLTGGSSITARPLHSNPVTFRPKHALILITNHKPKADPDDYALWKRVLLIPFTQAFVDKPVAFNEHKADPNLLEKLREESPGILAWLVRGCLAWRNIGLNPPSSVRAATDDYQTEEDDISQFIDECCVIRPEISVKASDLYKAYQKWAADNGIADIKNGKVFGEKVSKQYERARSSNNRVYRGIGLMQD